MDAVGKPLMVLQRPGYHPREIRVKRSGVDRMPPPLQDCGINLLYDPVRQKMILSGLDLAAEMLQYLLGGLEKLINI